MLREADNTSGYANVSLQASGGATPYKVAVRRGGKKVHLGHFATPEEAALCLARWHEKEERNAADKRRDKTKKDKKDKDD